MHEAGIAQQVLEACAVHLRAHGATRATCVGLRIGALASVDPDDVEIADLGTPGRDLTRHLSVADIVIALDALRGVEPGMLRVVDHAALLGGRASPRLDSHVPALEASVAMAHLAGDRPFDVTLVGLRQVPA